ncbi:sigma-70 family RNA polymerase sigma factor [Sphingomonas sp. ID0503]|uniref:sigma-70 family RNA polymerase sigma factor n=1 Tax=Sphingomonas sp. ID0503 TaxID=3399691 RepID=UPI003AFA88B1
MAFHAAIDTSDATPVVYTRVGTPKPGPEQLIRDNMKLVRRIAWHVHGSVSSAIEVEDLCQIGLVALIEAASSFEDRGQVTFQQYLNTRIRGAMIDQLRKQATETRGAMRRRREYQKAASDLSAELGRRAKEEEIAGRLGVTPEKLAQSYAGGQSVRLESIDSVYDDESPWFVSDDLNAEELLAQGELRQVLIEAITDLSEKEQMVVQLYYVEELNLEEIGQVLGVGAARVCQIKKAAHDKLRAAVKARTE